MAEPNQYPSWMPKQIGSEGWTPLDLLPVTWAYNQTLNAVTPNYEVPPGTGQVTAPPVTQYDFLSTTGQAAADQQGARAQQMALADLIAARARGEGPSIAEMQLRQATDRLQGQQAGMVASQRGMNPALQRRLIMQQAAQAQQGMNADAALLRAQEQQAAQALLGQQLAGVRGADLGMYGQSSQAGLNAGQLDLQSQQANQRAAMWEQEMKARAEEARAQANAGLLGGIASGLMTAATGVPVPGPIGGGAPRGGSTMPMTSVSSGAGNAANSWYPLDNYFSGSGANKSSGATNRGFADGGMVPGAAPKNGDHPANDVVPAWLSPGEAVVPRSIMQSPNAPAEAASFIAALKQQAGEPVGMANGGMVQQRRRTLAGPMSYLDRIGGR